LWQGQAGLEHVFSSTWCHVMECLMNGLVHVLQARAAEEAALAEAEEVAIRKAVAAKRRADRAAAKHEYGGAGEPLVKQVGCCVWRCAVMLDGVYMSVSACEGGGTGAGPVQCCYCCCW
jgi:hypothetical protein